MILSGASSAKQTCFKNSIDMQERAERIVGDENCHVDLKHVRSLMTITHVLQGRTTGCA